MSNLPIKLPTHNADGEDILESAKARFKAFDDKYIRPVLENGGVEGIKVGDRLSFYYTPYQHSPMMVVTKINRKSVVAYEVEGSYKAGTRWVLHKEWDGWYDTRHDTSFGSRNIPEGTRIY